MQPLVARQRARERRAPVTAATQRIWFKVVSEFRQLAAGGCDGDEGL